MRILILPISILLGNSLHAAVYPSSYDVVYDRISISVDPGSSAAITGTVTTWFKSTTANLSTIGFDLDQNMTITTISYHGIPLAPSAWTHTSNILLLQFPAPIALTGTLDSITISYNGTPVTPTTNIPSGYNWASHSGSNMIYTLGEAFTGHDWWPCKDSLVDKIDSVDLIVTTPSSYKVGANGIVTETISGSNKISTWRTRYPIATYLINFAVANYQDYSYTINTGITTPTNLPVHNYLFPEDYTTTNQTTLNSIKSILPVYVSLLNTDYPFLNEKYGTAECTNFGGALEVQSMTFVASGAYTTSILAHELSHQWFGDRVTTNDWHHIWLNEGFAEFFQYVIYPEKLQSAANALSSRQGLKNSVTNTSTTYVSNIANVDDIFIPSGSIAQPYEKGAMTLSMLRTWLGDNNFFAALNNYLNAPGLAYNFTSIDSVHAYMQAMSPSPNLNLTNFFNDWIYKQGRVKYVVNYQIVPNGIYFNLSQSPTVSGAGYFDMPVPIEIKGTGLDTTVVIIDQRGTLYNAATGATTGAIIHYNLSATPTSLSFDPNSLVLATATTNPVTTLPLLDITFTAIRTPDNVALNWDIRTDLPIQSITVEKSINGTDFTPAVVRSPATAGNGQYDDSWNDQQAGTGVTWYRLKLTLPDGSFDYSAIKMVEALPVAARLEIIPNPVQNICQIRLPVDFTNNQTAALTVYSQSGQLIQQIQVAGSNSIISLDCGHFAAGLYQLVLFNDKMQKWTGTFLKK